MNAQTAKPSAGPWSVPHFARPDVDCMCGYVLTDGYCGAVCTVHASGEGNFLKTGDNPKFEEACANAHLIAEAGNVYHETGLTPRQLADQRAELLALLVESQTSVGGDWRARRDAAIQRATGEQS